MICSKYGEIPILRTTGQVYSQMKSSLLKALYLSTFDATKKWNMPQRNWGQVYEELNYENRLT